MSDRKIYDRCANCGAPIYTKPSQSHSGGPRHCRKSDCLSARMKGANNPFWNKSHTSETKAKIASAKIGKSSGAKGIKKRPRTPEERRMSAELMRQEWAKNRDKRLKTISRGENHHWKKPKEERRHRYRFTKVQRADWMDESCLWCDSTENLVLDHVMPVAAGGMCIRENAQTLCQSCNLWKMWNVDRPLAIYAKATSGA